MSYTKIGNIPNDLESALTEVLIEAPTVTEKTKVDLIDSGSSVKLDTGEMVWVACMVQDDVTTHNIELFSIAIAFTTNVNRRPNGKVVHVKKWHSVDPLILSTLTVAVARKALMMELLGEPKPMVDGEEVFRKLSKEHEEPCIRTILSVVTEMQHDVTDVL